MAQLVLTAKQVQVRNLLRNTYLYMTIGLFITAIVGLITISTPSLLRLASNPMILLMAIIGEFALVIYLSARIMRMTTERAQLAFFLYSALNGFTLSMIFRVYTGESIFHTFLISAGAFGGMSLYALTTRKDLSGMGKYLIMGLWGVILASFINIFFRTSGFSMIISLVALLIFLGLTAYDTQMIYRWSQEYGDKINDDDYKRLSIIGALKLYLDFINIFLILLRFLGRRN